MGGSLSLRSWSDFALQASSLCTCLINHLFRFDRIRSFHGMSRCPHAMHEATKVFFNISILLFDTTKSFHSANDIGSHFIMDLILIFLFYPAVYLYFAFNPA